MQMGSKEKSTVSSKSTWSHPTRQPKALASQVTAWELGRPGGGHLPAAFTLVCKPGIFLLPEGSWAPVTKAFSSKCCPVHPEAL